MTKGKFEMTWIDFKHQNPVIVISSKSYKSVTVPNDFILRTSGNRTIGGFLEADVIKMEKINK